MYFPLLLMVWSAALAFKLPISFHSKKALNKHRAKRGDHLNELNALKSKLVLGIVDSICEEVTKSIEPNSLMRWGVDEVIATLPHAVAADLVSVDANLTQLDPLLSDMPHTTPSSEFTLTTANGSTATFKLMLIPVEPNPLATIDNETPGKVSQPHTQQSENKTTVADVLASNKLLAAVARHCIPPILLNYFPHRLPQLAIQWLHEHYIQFQDILHFIVTGHHLP